MLLSLSLSLFSERVKRSDRNDADARLGCAIIQDGNHVIDVAEEQAAAPRIFFKLAPDDKNGKTCVQVSMASPTTGALIRYTIDDSEPCTNSTVFDVSKGLCVRAHQLPPDRKLRIKAYVAVEPEMLDSPVVVAQFDMQVCPCLALCLLRHLGYCDYAVRTAYQPRVPTT